MEMRKFTVREIQLTRGHTSLVSSHRYDEVVAAGPWYPLFARRTDGSLKNVYAYRNTRNPDGKRTVQYLHRFIMGVDGREQIDHIDGWGLNNEDENLRIVNSKQNQANSRKQARKLSSRYKGVCWDKSRSRWLSCIQVDGRHITLGRHESEVEAALAYDSAAMKYFGEFAKLNFVGGPNGA
jgi:AP2 domain